MPRCVWIIPAAPGRTEAQTQRAAAPPGPNGVLTKPWPAQSYPVSGTGPHIAPLAPPPYARQGQGPAVSPSGQQGPWHHGLSRRTGQARHPVTAPDPPVQLCCKRPQPRLPRGRALAGSRPRPAPPTPGLRQVHAPAPASGGGAEQGQARASPRPQGRAAGDLAAGSRLLAPPPCTKRSHSSAPYTGESRPRPRRSLRCAAQAPPRRPASQRRPRPRGARMMQASEPGDATGEMLLP